MTGQRTDWSPSANRTITEQRGTFRLTQRAEPVAIVVRSNGHRLAPLYAFEAEGDGVSVESLYVYTSDSAAMNAAVSAAEWLAKYAENAGRPRL